MKEKMLESEISDATLLQAYLDGSSAAFEKLMDRHRQVLFNWLLGMTINRADAEDLYQEVWLRVIKNADRFNDISFKAWLWRIARNLLIDFRRKRKPDVSLDAVSSEDATPLVELLVATTHGPSKVVELDDLTVRVMCAVEQLPAMQREVFLMRTEAEMSFKEIAETLDIPLNTALGRMHDAIGKLKRVLGREVLP